MTDLEVRPLTPDLVPDFFRLHAERHGCGWCCCVAWHVPTWDGWGERGAARNRALRQGLFDGGELDGYLLYQAGEPVAWAQVGRRDRLPKLVAGFGLEPEPGVWALSCLLVRPDRRRQGLARRLVEDVVADLRARGVARLQAFPKNADDLDDGEVWTGPRGLYAALGFELRRPGEPRSVWELALHR
ncbi:MAG: GNAT family N-acetyltransferase [Planctomycetota bacterium]